MSAVSGVLGQLRAAYPNGVRAAAVEQVDRECGGHTYEFCWDPDGHRQQYDERTMELLAPHCKDTRCPEHGTTMPAPGARGCTLDVT
jgi:hypothetical protein